jgi:N-acetylmuramoyl-L-alanine amidase
MRSTVRTAAIAAAAFCFSAVVGLAGSAGPSIASEAAASQASSYTAHAGLALQMSGDLGLNAADEPGRLAEDIHFSTPIATHAIAPGDQGEILREAERDDRSLAALVDDYAGTETTDEEAECLARAVYYESKGEPLTGQLTVAEVIINRARSGRFPDSICGVVRQASQFSFVRRGVIPTPPQGSRDWRIAVAIARIAMQDLADGAAPNALFFHARHVNPRWRLTRVATVGNHVFYR